VSLVTRIPVIVHAAQIKHLTTAIHSFPLHAPTRGLGFGAEKNVDPDATHLKKVLCAHSSTQFAGTFVVSPSLKPHTVTPALPFVVRLTFRTPESTFWKKLNALTSHHVRTKPLYHDYAALDRLRTSRTYSVWTPIVLLSTAGDRTPHTSGLDNRGPHTCHQ
jgi:hypothetical protein